MFSTCYLFLANALQSLSNSAVKALARLGSCEITTFSLLFSTALLVQLKLPFSTVLPSTTANWKEGEGVSEGGHEERVASSRDHLTLWCISPLPSFLTLMPWLLRFMVFEPLSSIFSSSVTTRTCTPLLCAATSSSEISRHVIVYTQQLIVCLACRSWNTKWHSEVISWLY